MVISAGAVNVGTMVSYSTVKEAEQVTGGSQVLVTVNVTVFPPPQGGKSPELSFDMLALQPPLKLAEASQLANFDSMTIFD
ncbi:MAG: hypothetical protein JPMHGGIA_00015 [Saprospiraceae bacterium]|nr:hypothetical protein [Saprospiraceae bacterium]